MPTGFFSSGAKKLYSRVMLNREYLPHYRSVLCCNTRESNLRRPVAPASIIWGPAQSQTFESWAGSTAREASRKVKEKQNHRTETASQDRRRRPLHVKAALGRTSGSKLGGLARPFLSPFHCPLLLYIYITSQACMRLQGTSCYREPVLYSVLRYCSPTPADGVAGLGIQCLH